MNAGVSDFTVQLAATSPTAAAVIEGIRVEEIVAERAGVLALARMHAASIDAQAARGALNGADAEAMKRMLRGFADSVATGLHRGGEDPAGVRGAMKARVDG